MESITPEEARARVDAGRNLDAVSLHAADLAELGLAGRSFRDSVLVQVGFSHALLDAACFAGASLTECDLSGTTLTGGDLASALLARCNLERSVADRCRGHQLKLVDCRLDGAAWRDCDLEQAVCGNSTADGIAVCAGAARRRGHAEGNVRASRLYRQPDRQHEFHAGDVRRRHV